MRSVGELWGPVEIGGDEDGGRRGRQRCWRLDLSVVTLEDLGDGLGDGVGG